MLTLQDLDWQFTRAGDLKIHYGSTGERYPTIEHADQFNLLAQSLLS